uniref:hypothetical protein n=1 Tax=Phocaeicola vulgatus TaxID=821 RepID=UPI004027E055
FSGTWSSYKNLCCGIKVIKRYGWTLLGIVAGMVGGYLYWRYVGCTTGTCPITSSPVNSSIWGAAMGGLLLSSFMPEHRKIKKEE